MGSAAIKSNDQMSPQTLIEGMFRSPDLRVRPPARPPAPAWRSAAIRSFQRGHPSRLQAGALAATNGTLSSPVKAGPRQRLRASVNKVLPFDCAVMGARRARSTSRLELRRIDSFGRGIQSVAVVNPTDGRTGRSKRLSQPVDECLQTADGVARQGLPPQIVDQTGLRDSASRVDARGAPEAPFPAPQSDRPGCHRPGPRSSRAGRLQSPAVPPDR